MHDDNKAALNQACLQGLNVSFAGTIGKGFKGSLVLGVGFWVGLKSARVSIVAGGHLCTVTVNRSSTVWEYGGL